MSLEMIDELSLTESENRTAFVCLKRLDSQRYFKTRAKAFKGHAELATTLGGPSARIRRVLARA